MSDLITKSEDKTDLRSCLKAHTRAIHEKLDRRLMAFEPFSSRERYSHFLHTQYRLHRDVEALYQSPEMNAILPQLSERSRLDFVEQDLCDLGVCVPLADLPAPRFESPKVDNVAVALAWLYAVEGSNIGAAFLLKAAAKINLDKDFGARHLAPHPDGRASHWRDFIAQMNEVALTPAQLETCLDSANQAFTAALNYAELYCPIEK